MRTVPMMFKAKDHVEIIATDRGLQGSLLPAIVVRRMPKRRYLVEYKHLVCEKNRKVKLQEVVDVWLVRRALVGVFRDWYQIGEEVDALHRDCWWYGKIVKAYGRYYGIRFDGYRRVYYYRVEKIRLHQD